MARLEGKRVAVLVTNGFEEVEMTKPNQALKEAGAQVKVIAPEQKIKSWNVTDWGSEFRSDILLNEANPEEFDALLLPGGVLSPDKLRINDTAVDFVRHFTSTNKPIAAICHGPWTLIETGFIAGKKVTSYYSIKTDMVNAGGEWLNEEVVTDGNLVTSRKPDDISAFNKKIIEVFANTPEPVKV